MQLNTTIRNLLMHAYSRYDVKLSLSKGKAKLKPDFALKSL